MSRVFFFLHHHPVPWTEEYLSLHGPASEITGKIPINFLFAIESHEWESPKETFYRGLGAVLFICCKTDGLTLLIDIKIKAVSSSLCWSRLNLMGPCSNYQPVCSQKVRVLGLKERKVKEEKAFL